jgi:hypothetical protein
MSFSRPSTALAVCTTIGVALLAACSSDNTGPKTNPAPADALHYDSLAGQYLARGDQNSLVMAHFIEALNGVNADGVPPTGVPVVVGYNGQTPAGQNWLANYANLVDSAGQDSTQVFEIWSDPFVTYGISVRYRKATFHLMDLIAAGGDANPDSTETDGPFFDAPSGPCTVFTSIQNVYTPQFPDYDPSQSTCQLERAYETLTNITFGHDSTVTGHITQFEFPQQWVYGVRLQFTTEAAYGSAIARLPQF